MGRIEVQRKMQEKRWWSSPLNRSNHLVKPTRQCFFVKKLLLNVKSATFANEIAHIMSNFLLRALLTNRERQKGCNLYTSCLMMMMTMNVMMMAKSILKTELVEWFCTFSHIFYWASTKLLFQKSAQTSHSCHFEYSVEISIFTFSKPSENVGNETMWTIGGVLILLFNGKKSRHKFNTGIFGRRMKLMRTMINSGDLFH